MSCQGQQTDGNRGDYRSELVFAYTIHLYLHLCNHVMVTPKSPYFCRTLP